MAIQGKAVATALRIAVDVVREEEKRKKVLWGIFLPFLFFLIFFTLVIQILTSPLDFLAERFGWEEEKIKKIGEIKENMAEHFPLENIGNVGDIKKEGKYPFPLIGDFVVSSPFGYRSIIVNGTLQSGRHNGVDLVGVWHTPIISIADGVVVFSGQQRGYGNCIMIYHEKEGFYTFYAHLSKRYAIVDQKIKQYDVIALEGGAKSDPGAGTSTGHHLHFEIRIDGTKKTAVDPMPYLTKNPEEEWEEEDERGS